LAFFGFFCAVVASPGGTVEAVESAVDIDSLSNVPSLDKDKMEHVDKFYYLGDMISAFGGA